MGVRGPALARAVIVPGAMPQIGVGLRIGLGVAWTAIVAAELAVGAKAGGGTSGGVGQMMFAYYAYSIELNRIVVCMIAVGLVSLVLDRLVRLALARAMPWMDA
jgi:ABC-type nitrate/sulfonate/bicarbonate transport system permease component